MTPMRPPLVATAVAAVVAATATASAGPAQPVPGTVGLTRREVTLRDACATSWTKHTVTKRGDEPRLVAALTWPRISGLDFDPARKARAQASLKRFEAWLRGLQTAVREAVEVQTTIARDPAATPTARVEAIARVVLVSDQMAGLLRATEHPRGLRRDPEAVQIFCDTLDEQIAPIEQQAQDARDRCNQIIASAAIGTGWWTAVCAAP